MTNNEKIIKVREIVYDFYQYNDKNDKLHKREDALPRQVAHYFCKKYKYGSLSKIGSFIGSKNHATVLYSHKVISDLITYDVHLQNEILKLEKRVKVLKNKKKKIIKDGITYIYHSKYYNSCIR